MPPPRSPAKKAYIPPSRSSGKNAYRWRQYPFAQPLHTSCPGDDGRCPNPVSVRVCRGTREPRHDGYYYEACDPTDHPSHTHWITWREDLPRIKLPSSYKTRRPRPDASLADIINGNDVLEEDFTTYPPTPSKYPHSPHKQADKTGSYYSGGETTVEELFVLDHPATPTINRRVELPKDPLTEEDALQFSQYLDSVEEQEERLFQDNAIPSPNHCLSLSGLPVSSASVALSDENAGALDLRVSKASWSVGVKTERWINGKLRSICPGKGCEGKKDPPKAAQQCSFLLCKSCCAVYCSETSNYCKCPSHKAPVTEATILSTRMPSSQSTAPKPVVGLPLKQIHYERREKAMQDYNQTAIAVTSRRIYEVEESRTVDITFWDGDGTIHEFSEMSPTFPVFKLADCAEYVRTPIGLNPEIYYSETGRWRQVNISIPRRLIHGEMVLYRSPQSYGQSYKLEVPKEMEEAMSLQSQIRSSDSSSKGKLNVLKRKASHDLNGSGHHTRTRLEPNNHPESPPFSQVSPSMVNPNLLLDFPLHGELEYSNVQPAVTTSANIQIIRPIHTSNLQPLTPEDKVAPQSGHAPWPLKFFQPMMTGIQMIENMSDRDLELEKHKRAFPTSTAVPSTLARQMKYWRAASESLKSEFFSRPRSTWKEFCNKVEDTNGGSVPGLKSQKKDKDIKGKGKAIVKMQDFDEICVKTEDEEKNVIIISDSDG
ncbi:hypothetical protein E1B28_001914 [Marasmius oreades]|uniref:Uncharacterized protein n=1 Tax=Marasmius oreades TaxID=181124 RepID=A0A9P7V4D2_9AGAR|nr:uncharacterized protein E1B28_001914 [Marasmius oreades]KAG7100134.1 hypothetical protein E1B28_001914 [Marasmius oreades]